MWGIEFGTTKAINVPQNSQSYMKKRTAGTPGLFPKACKTALYRGGFFCPILQSAFILFVYFRLTFLYD